MQCEGANLIRSCPQNANFPKRIHYANCGLAGEGVSPEKQGLLARRVRDRNPLHVFGWGKFVAETEIDDIEGVLRDSFGIDLAAMQRDRSAVG